MEAPQKVAELLLRQSGMVDAYIAAASKCGGWNQGNLLADLLPAIRSLSETQLQAMVAAYNSNGELRGSYGFNGQGSAKYGIGLKSHISRITGRSFDFDAVGVLKELK